MDIKETKDLWTRLKESSKPILLFGLGDGAEKIAAALKQYGKSPDGVFCSDDLYREKHFLGFKVIKYATAKEIFKDMIVLMSFGSFKEDVFEIAKGIAREQEFYVPDVPVFGGGLFNFEYFKAHERDLENVYASLADEKSKQVFNNVINFKLSGNPNYLYACETDADEAFKGILRLDKSEEYLDLGAYDGDTVKEFIGFTNGEYSGITALEPDAKNFKKLQNTAADIKGIELINAAVSDENGTASFDLKGGRSSCIDIGGKATVDTVTVDSLNKPFTYIKMDVEGNELKAIKGAEQTLKKYKPKLLISAYHRNEDMFALPNAVLKANPDYKLYIRHYKYLPAWDTNYYFV